MDKQIVRIHAFILHAALMPPKEMFQQGVEISPAGWLVRIDSAHGRVLSGAYFNLLALLCSPQLVDHPLEVLGVQETS